MALLFVAVACIWACDPDSENQPECNAENLNMAIRNFQDPTHYWMCKSSGAVAESIRCPDAHGFDSIKGACIHFSEWQWVDPCPSANNN